MNKTKYMAVLDELKEVPDADSDKLIRAKTDTCKYTLFPGSPHFKR